MKQPRPFFMLCSPLLQKNAAKISSHTHQSYELVFRRSSPRIKQVREVRPLFLDSTAAEVVRSSGGGGGEYKKADEAYAFLF